MTPDLGSRRRAAATAACTPRLGSRRACLPLFRSPNALRPKPQTPNISGAADCSGVLQRHRHLPFLLLHARLQASIFPAIYIYFAMSHDRLQTPAPRARQHQHTGDYPRRSARRSSPLFAFTAEVLPSSLFPPKFSPLRFSGCDPRASAPPSPPSTRSLRSLRLRQACACGCGSNASCARENSSCSCTPYARFTRSSSCWGSP